MKQLLVGLAALPFLAGVAMAGQPMPLNDTQMDKVTAGLEFEHVFGNGGFVELHFPVSDGIPCNSSPACFADLQGLNPGHDVIAEIPPETVLPPLSAIPPLPPLAGPSGLDR